MIYNFFVGLSSLGKEGESWCWNWDKIQRVRTKQRVSNGGQQVEL